MEDFFKMKKIVGILVVAAIATSLFAADISAATNINGKLFSFNDGAVNLFSQGNDSHDYANPNFVLSLNGDKAGATVKITTDGGTLTTSQTTQTIWFKPFDALKISLGNYDLALNKEQIDWTESVTGLGGNGYVFSINASGVAFDFFLNEGNNNAWWMNKAKDGDPALAEFGFKFGYSADFGSIGAFVDFNRTRINWTYHDNLFGAPKGDGTYTSRIDDKDGTLKNILFGAGYRNNFNGVDAFLNVAGYMGDSFDWLRPEIYVSGAVDVFGYSLFVAPVIWTNSDLNKDFECELVAKFSYALDGVTPYAYFKDNNLLAKDFAATVKLGATVSVGAMGWNAWLQMDIADTTAISVPFELTVSF